MGSGFDPRAGHVSAVDNQRRPSAGVAGGGKALLRTGEVALILGVSRKTVTRWARTGQVPTLPRTSRRGHYLFRTVEVLTMALQSEGCEVTGHAAALWLNLPLEVVKHVARPALIDPADDLPDGQRRYDVGLLAPIRQRIISNLARTLARRAAVGR